MTDSNSEKVRQEQVTLEVYEVYNVSTKTYDLRYVQTSGEWSFRRDSEGLRPGDTWPVPTGFNGWRYIGSLPVTTTTDEPDEPEALLEDGRPRWPGYCSVCEGKCTLEGVGVPR